MHWLVGICPKNSESDTSAPPCKKLGTLLQQSLPRLCTGLCLVFRQGICNAVLKRQSQLSWTSSICQLLGHAGVVKPGTHWRQRWIQHGRLCWKSTVAETGNKSATTWIRQLIAVDFVADTVDFVTSVYGAKATRSTFNKVDRVEFSFVASVYPALSVLDPSCCSTEVYQTSMTLKLSHRYYFCALHVLFRYNSDDCWVLTLIQVCCYVIMTTKE